MRFGQPIPITEGVFQIQAIGARVTVLVEDGDALLVDAGFRGSAGLITQGLEALGLSPDRIGRIVVTHAHPDHSGGLAELVAGRDIGVAAHRLEADGVICFSHFPPMRGDPREALRKLIQRQAA